MATAFKQVKNNARTGIATAPSPATSGTSLIVTTGKGTLFPTPGNGFWATIWNKTTYPDPTDDAAMEIVLVTAVSTDTFTITRAQLGTSARTVTTSDTIALLDVDQLFKDMATAINTIEGAYSPREYDAIVAPSGGDYTLISTALTAGARSIYVRSGSYTEVAAISTAWTGTKSIKIVGEDRITTVITLPNSASGYMLLNIAGSYLGNLTVKAGTTALADNTTNGYITLSGNNSIMENCEIYGNNSNVVGTTFISSGNQNTVRGCNFQNNASNGGDVYYTGTDFLFEKNTIIDTRATYLLQTASSFTLVARAVIKNNTFTASGQTLTIELFGNYTSFHDNTVTNTYAGTSTTFFVMGADNRYGSVHSNKFISGQHILQANDYISIIGNYFDNSSSTVASAASAILDAGLANRIVGNHFLGGANNYSGVGNTPFGVGTRADTVVMGNTFSNYTKANTAAIETNNGRIGVNYFNNCTNEVQSWNSGYASTVLTMELSANPIAASTASTAIDLKQYRGHVITLSSNTTFTFTEDSTTKFRMPMWFELQLVQDATGSRTVTWPASVSWSGGTAPTLTTTANKRDIFQFRYEPTANKYYGSIVGQNY